LYHAKDSLLVFCQKKVGQHSFLDHNSDMQRPQSHQTMVLEIDATISKNHG